MTAYNHLEALHTVAAVPYEADAGPRANKENILEAYGFSKGANPAEITDFVFDEQNPPDVETHLTEHVEAGRYTALLFRGGKWEAMGGLPVVYVMDEKDIKERLTFEDGKLVEVEADGMRFAPEEGSRATGYTRRKSQKIAINGFENYDETLEVGLGGGFRLQIDGVEYERGIPQLTMSAYFSFNDYGSRVLAKETEEHAKVPMANKAFRVPIVDGKLVLPVKDMTVGDVATASDAMDVVLSKLFEQDGEAIDKLTRDLMTVRSIPEVHQFEGIYGVNPEAGVSAEVIDFDGIDTFDVRSNGDEQTPIERLTGGQLVNAGYLPTVDKGDLVTYHRQQGDMRSELARLSESEEVSDVVKGIAGLRQGEDITAYARRLQGQGRMARALGYCGIAWTETGAPNVQQFETGDLKVTRVEAGGFMTAFVERDGQLIDTSDGKKILEVGKQVAGYRMLKLYVDLSKEGD
ncbi:MAG TPA: hypothetical protein VD735_07615 [Candidatus Saccharimonadales bacterium]|nr:hypothetical protein [Candidatus Saccharimonadales bacterium]